MKHIRKYIPFVLIAVAGVMGCDTDELRNRNNNPQALTEVPMEFLFTAAQLSSASGGGAGDNRYIDWRTNIGFAGYAIQQLASGDPKVGIAPGDKYTDNVESYNAPWEFLYGDQLKNLGEVLRQTSRSGFDASKTNLRSAARILKVFNFHRLTDYYGNIPYSNALKGIDLVFLPSYDNQQSIYLDMLNELEEATDSLAPLQLSTNRDDQAFVAADLFYDGNIDQWKKFGYSLMLRLAMRISNADEATANEYVAKAVAGGVFTSSDDNVWVPMAEGPSEWTNRNGISRAFIGSDGGQPTSLSKTLIDELKGSNTGSTSDDDPRLMIFSGGVGYRPNPTDPLVQEGLPNGLDVGLIRTLLGIPKDSTPDIVNTFSRINAKLLQLDDPYMLMNYAEVELLLADAGERGIGGVPEGDAEMHYENGVRAAMQMYTPFDASFAVSDAKVNDYLAQRPYPVDKDGRLEAIGTQLWLSKFFNWWDAWADWRRTGYPILDPVDYPGNVTGGTIPRKLRVPAQEVASNSANFEAGGSQPNSPTTRVWWDTEN